MPGLGIGSGVGLRQRLVAGAAAPGPAGDGLITDDGSFFITDDGAWIIVD